MLWDTNQIRAQSNTTSSIDPLQSIIRCRVVSNHGLRVSLAIPKKILLQQALPSLGLLLVNFSDSPLPTVPHQSSTSSILSQYMLNVALYAGSRIVAGQLRPYYQRVALSDPFTLTRLARLILRSFRRQFRGIDTMPFFDSGGNTSPFQPFRDIESRYQIRPVGSYVSRQLVPLLSQHLIPGSTVTISNSSSPTPCKDR